MFKNILKKKERISAGKINASEINSITISADNIGINNKYGHYEIANYIGQTTEIQLEDKILVFMGGILVNIKNK